MTTRPETPQARPAAAKQVRRTWLNRLRWGLALLALVAATGWARATGPAQQPPAEHGKPATVAHVAGNPVAVVTLTAEGARRIGLAYATVAAAQAAGYVTVPYAALVYSADGQTWVYAVDGSPLRFVRRPVAVHEVVADQVVLRTGPPPGTSIAGVGSAELFGAEFEIGH